MSYNLTQLYNITNPMEIITNVNALSDGYFAIFILLTIYLIVWVMFAYMPKDQLMIIDGFICTVVGILLFVTEMISFSIFILPVLSLFAGIFINSASKE